MPKTHPAIKFLIPIFITYLVLLIINTVAPSLNESTKRLKTYIRDRSLTNINNMGCMQIF